MRGIRRCRRRERSAVGHLTRRGDPAVEFLLRARRTTPRIAADVLAIARSPTSPRRSCGDPSITEPHPGDRHGFQAGERRNEFNIATT